MCRYRFADVPDGVKYTTCTRCRCRLLRMEYHHQKGNAASAYTDAFGLPPLVFVYRRGLPYCRECADYRAVDTDPPPGDPTGMAERRARFWPGAGETRGPE